MLRIKDILVDDAVADLPFACDLPACRGACCTMPGSKGAPLLDDETRMIHQWYPAIAADLPPAHRDIIERDGPYDGEPGHYTTTVVDSRACVFVLFDGGIATCAFERAYEAGRIAWRKPLSCHLFPIRVRPQTPPFLEFEFIAECRRALDRGARERIYLDTFLRDALTRYTDAAWVGELRSACAARRTERGFPAQS